MTRPKPTVPFGDGRCCHRFDLADLSGFQLSAHDAHVAIDGYVVDSHVVARQHVVESVLHQVGIYRQDVAQRLIALEFEALRINQGAVGSHLHRSLLCQCLQTACQHHGYQNVLYLHIDFSI